MAKPKEISLDKVKQELENHPDWFLTEEENQLATGIEFENFSQAVEFLNDLATLADAIEHHPDVYIYDYKFMQIMVSTHDIDGFSEKDIEFMETFDKAYQEADESEKTEEDSNQDAPEDNDSKE